MPRKDPFRLIFLIPSPEEAEGLANALRNAGLLIFHRHLDNVQGLESLLPKGWDLILSQGGVEAIQALAVLKKHQLDIPLMVLSQEPASSEATDPLAYGAKDAIDPSIQPLFIHAVRRELDALEQRRAHERCQHTLQECEERNRTLMDSSRDAIAYIHEGMHIYANPAYLELFGFDREDELEGIPLLDMIAPEDIPRFKTHLRRYQETGKTEPLEIHALRIDGQRFRVSVELSHARMGGESCMQIVFREVKTPQVSQLDPLTGLHLRPHFLDALAKAVGKSQQGQGSSALCLITLDNLPEIRHALGIAASDRILAQTAEWLSQHLPPQAMAARFSDNALAVLIEGTTLDETRTFADDLRREIEGRVFDIQGKTAITTLSIGVVLVTAQTKSAEEALRDAESACHKAMKAGGNQVVIHQRDLQSLEEEAQWPKRLQEAMMQEGRLRLYFQPIVPLHGEVKPMYEVLLRFIDEKGKVILPETFLPFAARAGMMPAIDRWVTERAIKTLSEQDEPVHLFVKLADETLLDEGFIPWLGERIKADLPAPQRLIFEIEELSATTHLKQAKAFVEGLHALHIGVAIAHFGEGINPFGILKHVKADYLMIDGAFIHHLARDPDKQEAVRSLVDKAKALSQTVIAENVEDANSLALLWQYGVHYARGHYIQVPSDTLNFDFLASL